MKRRLNKTTLERKPMFDFVLCGHVTLDEPLKDIDDTLNIGVNPPVVEEKVEAKLSHVEEANLYCLDYISNLGGVKTCDLSSTGLALRSEIANEFDFIFITPEQKSLVPEDFKRRLVVHSNKETIVYKAGEQIAHYENLVDDTLIEDDKFFIACYIYGTIHARDDTHCAEMSHRLTVKRMKDRQTET